MERLLNILLVENDENDAELTLRELRKSHLTLCVRRVATEAEYVAQLKESEPDVILVDFTTPGFGEMRALEIAREMTPDSAFIFVSGAIGKETAVQMLELGATDYVLKNNLVRLAPVVRRALGESQERRARKAMDLQLRESELRFRQITENIKEVFWLTDPGKDAVLYVSPAYADIWGRSCEALSASPRDWLDAIHPEDCERVSAAMRSKQILGTYDEEYRIVRLDGAIRWIHDKAFPVADKEGTIYRIVGVAEDITERKRSEERARRGAAQTHNILASITDAFFAVDEHWRMTYLNANAERLLRRSKEMLLGRNLWDEFPETVHSAFYVNCQKAVTNQTPVEFEEYYSPFETWFEVHAYPYERGLSVYFRDITERKRTEERISYLAHYDSLTGFPNRTLFRDRLTLALGRALRDSRPIAIMLLDLDRFKNINESLGHLVGDQILQTVAARLKAQLPEVDTISRLVGDEFIFIVETIAGMEKLDAIAVQILAALSQPIDTEDVEVLVTASIGIATSSPGPGSADELLKNADIAMYHAKHEGRNNYQFYNPALIHEKTPTKLSLEAKLRRALEREEFVLLYQPQVDIETRGIIAVEALIRWRSPDLGIVSPSQFIPLAEESGLIVPIGEWVLRTACSQNRAWHVAGLPTIAISVNLSPRQFRHKDLLESISRILKESRLDARFLELEITESMAMHRADETKLTLTRLNESGIRLAIDDFGTGYSSLSHLKRFPFHKLKIDKTFIRDLTTDPDDAAIVSAIIAMARSLKRRVIAEGVETQEQLEFLDKLDCDEYQGYLFSKPVDADAIAGLLSGTSNT
jgi:diguanylate cyclase (GGDEF)-like protein/PAS domain S-box-containing protein